MMHKVIQLLVQDVFTCSAVGARRVHVFEREELDPSLVAQIFWCQDVQSRPFGQTTSSQSQHQHE